jgi:hypothetical protein
LDITRERRPPHYHVALFPDDYRSHVAELVGEEELTRILASFVKMPEAPEPVKAAVSAPVSAMAAVMTQAQPLESNWTSLLVVVSLFVLILGAWGVFAQSVQKPHAHIHGRIVF